jgi:hypothetical protein
MSMVYTYLLIVQMKFTHVLFDVVSVDVYLCTLQTVYVPVTI